MITALLVNPNVALEECNHYFKEDITKDKFIKKLREQGIEVFSSIDDFTKLKDSLKGKTKHKVESK